jgi:hypothetical protein
MTLIEGCFDNTCPFCGSLNVQHVDYAFEGDEAWERIQCDECHEHWTIVYTFRYTYYFKPNNDKSIHGNMKGVNND